MESQTEKLEDFGGLMLGTRLKRLSDRLYADVDALYKRKGVPVSSRCFAALITLYHREGATSVSDLAEALGQSHAAVSQVSKLLCKAGLIEHKRDVQDERRRLLYLSTEGKALCEKVKNSWTDIGEAVEQAIHQSGFDLLSALSAFEQQLNQTTLIDRIEQREALKTLGSIEIIAYEPAYADAFKQLNVEWLEKHFYVEEIDNRVLSEPEKYILSGGGFIFFARCNGDIVGTSALIYQASEGSYELSKMSVTEEYQGLGIGKKLAVAAIEQFNSLGATKLFLESNSRLQPAIALYEKLGFIHQTPLSPSHYSRADVYMVYKPSMHD